MKNTKIAYSIGIIVLLTLSAVAVAVPQAMGHTPAWDIPTFAYVTASPSQVGVGETVIWVMWLNAIPPTAGGTGGDLWRGFTLKITAPDGSVTNLGPYTSGPVGTTWADFVPTQVGTYTAVFSWPGQVLTAPAGSNPMGLPYVGDNFLPATSAPVTLTVTSNPTPLWQEPPLPTGFWSRPMNAQNRQWSQLATNWLGGTWLVGNIHRYGRAPDSPHIIWTQPIAEQPGVSSAHPGGISDGQWTGQSFDTDDYQSPWSTPIIMNGIIYYNSPGDAMSPRYGYYAMDLRTGEQLWYNNGTNNNVVIANPSFGEGPALAQSYPRLAFGQLFHYNSVNGQGIVGYLWMTQGSTWYMLDPDNGNFLMGLRNVPGGVGVTDQDGSILYYNYNTTSGRVTAWNSTQAIPYGAPGTSTSAEQWRPRIGVFVDAQNDQTWKNYPLPVAAAGTNGAWTAADTYHSAYSVNTTLQAGLPWVNAPSYSPNFGTTRVLQDDSRVPRMLFSWNNPTAQGDVTGGNGNFKAWAAQINYNAAPREGPTGSLAAQSNWNLEQTVTLLWSKEYSPPISSPANLTWLNGPIDYDNQVFTVFSKETMQWFGYSLADGSLMWGPTQPQNPWDQYGPGGTIMYGNLYSNGYGGILYCYDVKTGNLKWTYEATNIGGESPYGQYPLSLLAVADGKLYLGSSEHSPTKPLWRGSFLRCVDAINGHEVFKLETWVDGLAIADGYIVSANHYNNMIQAIGRGPSATTIDVSQKAVGNGTAVLIQGTVTDQSPGKTALGMPAAGTPAISDNYMKEWMEYLYMQQALPTNAQGVPVTLTAIDQNGGATPIGTATSDLSGIYSYMWTPTNVGTYKIVASFDGSHSYFASSAETALGVSQIVTSTTTTATTSTGAPMEVVYALAIVLAIVIIVLAIVVIRKK